ncbi:hypothetical protein SAY86_021374 [Trapa natans]|uniref:DUF1475 domain-containing protein n=1 Tax=Trapa natans TaxID=22666 RepID=A0AAN7MKB3_TRANT|nr:hypothetical protein SAY86_021374 [Trapa natans]
MATPLLVTGLRSLFLILGFAMVATLIYTISTDGLPFRRDLLTPWMAATLVDFYTVLFPIAVWVAYKEQNAFTAIVSVILLICLGSITTSFYIFLQFLKLSPQESMQDPVYHVLLRNSSKNPSEQKRKHSPVVMARIIFIALGCLMLATLLYTILTDGSPFRKELLTP